MTRAAATPGGMPTWGTTMGYEQLLTIQQQKHELAMQHRDAELAHLRARLGVVEAVQPVENQVFDALKTKDEEAAVMMAAKYKELELLAGVLQLREQQTKDEEAAILMAA